MTSVQIDIKDGLSSSTAVKGPCRVATTANITLSGEQTIDGVAVVTDDRVLVKDQTTASENGIYVADTGSWRRSKDFNKTRDIRKGTHVYVTDGTVGAGEYYVSSNDPITVSSSSISFVFAIGGISGSVPISHGGTGQTTASAAFDALSPTTTRGDIVFRNATTNARLAASTAGYHLQTNGAGTDPTWAGFLQAGTSAATRTWQDKARDFISVKDFGAVGDGVANDTTAIQAAETYRATIGGGLYFPAGTYLVTGITVNRANGGSWFGFGNVKLIPNANSTVLVTLSGAVISQTLSKVFSIIGIEFHNNTKTGCTGILENSPYYTHIERCKFNSLQFSVIFTSPNSSTQTGWITISDIDQVGEGSWLFRGFDDTRYIFNININNFNQQGTGASTWSGVNALFHFQRGVSVYLNNINAASLDGATKGVYMQGDCQGVFLNNVIIGWPTYGVHAVVWTDTLIPSYVYINNCGMDQPAVAGYDITGRTWLMSNFNATNGRDRSSTGPGIHIQAAATDICISGALVAYMNNDGLAIETGAAKVRVSGLTSENNNQIAGAYYDINLNACTYVDVGLFGKNVVGTAGVNATGQRVVNGVTSKEVSRNSGSVATTAIITQEDLMSYTIPANVLKPGQRVKLTAWGTTAANANTKTIRLWFGGNSILDHAGAWSATPWRLTAELVITGASAQEYFGVAIPTAVVPTARQGTLTVTDTATIITKMTGQNGTAAAADITCQGFTVEILD